MPGPSPFLARLGLATVVAGSAASLAVAIGGDVAAGDRTGWYRNGTRVHLVENAVDRGPLAPIDPTIQETGFWDDTPAGSWNGLVAVWTAGSAATRSLRGHTGFRVSGSENYTYLELPGRTRFSDTAVFPGLGNVQGIQFTGALAADFAQPDFFGTIVGVLWRDGASPFRLRYGADETLRFLSDKVELADLDLALTTHTLPRRAADGSLVDSALTDDSTTVVSTRPVTVRQATSAEIFARYAAIGTPERGIQLSRGGTNDWRWDQYGGIDGSIAFGIAGAADPVLLIGLSAMSQTVRARGEVFVEGPQAQSPQPESSRIGGGAYWGTEFVRVGTDDPLHDRIQLMGRLGGADGYTASVRPPALTDDRTFTLPDRNTDVTIHGAALLEMPDALPQHAIGRFNASGAMIASAITDPGSRVSIGRVGTANGVEIQGALIIGRDPAQSLPNNHMAINRPTVSPVFLMSVDGINKASLRCKVAVEGWRFSDPNGSIDYIDMDATSINCNVRTRIAGTAPAVPPAPNSSEQGGGAYWGTGQIRTDSTADDSIRTAGNITFAAASGRLFVGTGNVISTFRVDFPGITSQIGTVTWYRTTNTTAACDIEIHRANGTSDIAIQLRAKTLPFNPGATQIGMGQGVIAVGTEYRVGGTKVVGARGAAVADATDAASAITQLNTALARLREHGLIAA